MADCTCNRDYPHGASPNPDPDCPLHGDGANVRVKRIEAAIGRVAIVGRGATSTVAAVIAAQPSPTVESIAGALYFTGAKGGKAAALEAAKTILTAAQSDEPLLPPRPMYEEARKRVENTLTALYKAVGPLDREALGDMMDGAQDAWMNWTPPAKAKGRKEVA